MLRDVVLAADPSVPNAQKELSTTPPYLKRESHPFTPLRTAGGVEHQPSGGAEDEVRQTTSNSSTVASIDENRTPEPSRLGRRRLARSATKHASTPNTPTTPTENGDSKVVLRRGAEVLAPWLRRRELRQLEHLTFITPQSAGLSLLQEVSSSSLRENAAGRKGREESTGVTSMWPATVLGTGFAVVATAHSMGCDDDTQPSSTTTTTTSVSSSLLPHAITSTARGVRALLSMAALETALMGPTNGGAAAAPLDTKPLFGTPSTTNDNGSSVAALCLAHTLHEILADRPDGGAEVTAGGALAAGHLQDPASPIRGSSTAPAADNVWSGVLARLLDDDTSSSSSDDEEGDVPMKGDVNSSFRSASPALLSPKSAGVSAAGGVASPQVLRATLNKWIKELAASIAVDNKNTTSLQLPMTRVVAPKASRRSTSIQASPVHRGGSGGFNTGAAAEVCLTLDVLPVAAVQYSGDVLCLGPVPLTFLKPPLQTSSGEEGAAKENNNETYYVGPAGDTSVWREKGTELLRQHLLDIATHRSQLDEERKTRKQRNRAKKRASSASSSTTRRNSGVDGGAIASFKGRFVVDEEQAVALSPQRRKSVTTETGIGTDEELVAEHPRTAVTSEQRRDASTATSAVQTSPLTKPMSTNDDDDDDADRIVDGKSTSPKRPIGSPSSSIDRSALHADQQYGGRRTEMLPPENHEYYAGGTNADGVREHGVPTLQGHSPNTDRFRQLTLPRSPYGKHTGQPTPVSKELDRRHSLNPPGIHGQMAYTREQQRQQQPSREHERHDGTAAADLYSSPMSIMPGQGLDDEEEPRAADSAPRPVAQRYKSAVELREKKPPFRPTSNSRNMQGLFGPAPVAPRVHIQRPTSQTRTSSAISRTNASDLLEDEGTEKLGEATGRGDNANEAGGPLSDKVSKPPASDNSVPSSSSSKDTSAFNSRTTSPQKRAVPSLHSITAPMVSSTATSSASSTCGSGTCPPTASVSSSSNVGMTMNNATVGVGRRKGPGMMQSNLLAEHTWREQQAERQRLQKKQHVGGVGNGVKIFAGPNTRAPVVGVATNSRNPSRSTSEQQQHQPQNATHGPSSSSEHIVERVLEFADALAGEAAMSVGGGLPSTAALNETGSYDVEATDSTGGSNTPIDKAAPAAAASSRHRPATLKNVRPSSTSPASRPRPVAPDTEPYEMPPVTTTFGQPTINHSYHRVSHRDPMVTTLSAAGAAPPHSRQDLDGPHRPRSTTPLAISPAKRQKYPVLSPSRRSSNSSDTNTLREAIQSSLSPAPAVCPRPVARPSEELQMMAHVKLHTSSTVSCNAAPSFDTKKNGSARSSRSPAGVPRMPHEGNSTLVRRY